MITKGFEWALQFGEPKKHPSLVFKMQPPCCKLKWDAGLKAYRCASAWKPLDWVSQVGGSDSESKDQTHAAFLQVLGPE